MSIVFALFQPLVDDGFNLDGYKINKQNFQSCGGCMDPYSIEIKPPLLLECGHFICQQCWTHYKQLCSFCNKARGMRQQNYTKLLDLQANIRKEQIANSQKVVYDFAAKLNDSKVFSLLGVQGMLTFRQLFAKIPQFQDYEKALKGNIILHINDVGVIFEDIQHLTINQYNEYLRVKKSKTRGVLVASKVRSNMITFNKRFDGGSKDK